MPLSFQSGLQGVIAAAVTPRGKAGDVNFGATFEIIDYLCAAKVHAIALFTAWGEYPALTGDDRARLTYLAVKRSRVPVLAGVGSATLDQSLELAREARSAGVAVLLVPPPLFYRYDAHDLQEFYLQFAAQLGSGPPLILSGEIDAETTERVLATGRYAGRENGESDFVKQRSAGLGVLSAAACAAPELTMALDFAIAANDAARVVRLEALRQELNSWLDQFPLPVGLKTAVEVRGIKTGALPIPLARAKQECLEQFRGWFKTWLAATRKLAAHG